MVDTARRNTGAEGGVAGGVGVTALLVAAARAIETHRPDSLAQDAYAEHFVLAAPASEGWPVRPREVPGGDRDPLWGRFARYFGLRTRVLDDFLLQSVHAGNVRQVVLLGAGLDARAFRLDWPPGCVIFEIDRGRCWRSSTRCSTVCRPSRRRRACQSRWICAPTGRGPCPARASTRPRRASGWSRGCCSTCLRPPRRISSTRSTDSAPEEARWPSRSSWRRTSWRTATARSTRPRGNRSASTCSTSSTWLPAPTPQAVWRTGVVHRRPHPVRLHPPARARTAARGERRAGG